MCKPRLFVFYDGPSLSLEGMAYANRTVPRIEKRGKQKCRLGILPITIEGTWQWERVSGPGRNMCRKGNLRR